MTSAELVYATEIDQRSTLSDGILLCPVRADKEISGRIKPEWLGAEARVGIPLRRLDKNRFRLWGRQSPTGSLLLSFVSGLAIGGCYVLFNRSRDRSHQRFAGQGHSGGSVNISTEVTHG